MLLLPFFVFLVVAVARIKTEIIPYQDVRVYPVHPQYLEIPKYAPGDAPKWKPGNGSSFIDLSGLKLSIVCSAGGVGSKGGCPNAKFDLLMFEEPPAKPWMDYWPDRQFCCTGEMAAAGDCTADQVGKLILPADIPEAFLRTLTVPAGRETSLEEDGVAPHHDIVKSGIYILLMSNCDAASFPVKISGQIVSMDPYGYLPGDLFGNLPFYGALSCLYGLLGVVWLVYCAMYSEQLMALQLWITFVLALGMVETTTLFLHYLMWNHHGKPTIAVTFVALFFGVSKRSVSRVVVLLVSLGYGVVRPTLGEELHKVLYLGGAYFLLSLVYTVATSLPAANHAADESEYDMLSMVVFVLAAVDTAFYVWILTALNNLLGGLAARKQAAKYILYRNFRAVLFVSLFATCVWVLYGSVINLNTGHGEDNNWKDHWTVDALWEMTYFLIFVAIAFMWAPSNNSLRYAYAVEFSLLDTDDEWQKAGLGSPDADGNGGGGGGDDDGAEGGNAGGGAGGGGEGAGEAGKDPFASSGALDTHMAVAKKQ